MSPPPDVWVYWAPPPKAFEQFRYLPLVATIETAFREHGNMSTVWTDASLQCGFNLTKQPDCHDVVRDLRRLGRRGKVGYLVVVGYWNRRVSYNTETIARCAAEPNVKLVLYQSEPLFGIGLAAAAEREREALSYQPDELWDYAQSNLLFLKNVTPRRLIICYSPSVPNVIGLSGKVQSCGLSTGNSEGLHDSLGK